MSKTTKKPTKRGAPGGNATKKKHGIAHFSKLAKRRWRIERKKKQSLYELAG